MVSVTEDRTLNWRAEDGRAACRSSSKEGRREEQAPVYKENGAVVALRRRGARRGRALRRARRLRSSSTSAPGFTVHDLEDFWMAERLLRQPRVLFRVDGGAALGMGHVYRSLAIADALRGLSRGRHRVPDERRPRGGARHRLARAATRCAWWATAGWRPTSSTSATSPPPSSSTTCPPLDAAYLRALSHLGATTVNLVDTLDDLETTEHYEQVIVSVMNQDRETPEGFYGGPRLRDPARAVPRAREGGARRRRGWCS